MTANPKEKNAVQGRYAVQEVNVKTADYTLQPTDNGTVIVVNSGSGKTITVPATLPNGFVCDFVQIGAGAITYAAGASATVNRLATFTLVSAGQYAHQRLSVYSNTTGLAAIAAVTGQLVAA